VLATVDLTNLLLFFVLLRPYKRAWFLLSTIWPIRTNTLSSFSPVEAEAKSSSP
jgi:hypothetical protein